MARVATGRMGGGNGAPAPGAQGTLGGIKQAVGARPGTRGIALGDAQYLWILVGLEVLAIGALRNKFSRYHGG